MIKGEIHMVEDNTINDMFGEEEMIRIEDQLWGKNPRRSTALKDLWLDLMAEAIDADEKPESAKREMLFLMAANNILDMVMEALPEDLAMDLTISLDSLIGVSLVNRRFDVDIWENNYQAISKLKREDYDSDEEFEQAVKAMDERWWTVGKQALGGRTPNDAIVEEMSKYRLNR